MEKKIKAGGLDIVLQGKDDISEVVDKDVETDREQSPTQVLLKNMFGKGIIDKTEFSNEEIGHFSRLMLLGNEWDIKEIKDFVNIFAVFRISKNRMGRTEGFSVAEKESEAKIKASSPNISFFGGKMPQL